MIPVRIVAVCEDGHIQDFPFRQWVGCPEKDPAVCELQFKAGRSSASLAGIKIECTRCNRIKTLAGAFERGALATPLDRGSVKKSVRAHARSSSRSCSAAVRMSIFQS
jgi:hypothetical protein